MNIKIIRDVMENGPSVVIRETCRVYKRIKNACADLTREELVNQIYCNALLSEPAHIDDWTEEEWKVENESILEVNQE